MTLITQPFKHLRANKDRVSASQYNRLVDLVTKMSKSLMTNGIMDSSGFITRRQPLISAISLKIFEVQSEADGDGIYNCYKQTLDATEWDDTTGSPKFDDENTTSVEVLNLAEYDPDEDYTAALSANDLLAAWQMTDDEGTKRWIGLPLELPADERERLIHKAYCKNDAGAATTITCFLDEDTTGDEIVVNCSIAGGGNLDSALPYLTDGLPIFVTEIDEVWYCVTTFQKWDLCE